MRIRITLLSLFLSMIAVPVFAQQKMDTRYGKEIKAYTTQSDYLSNLVDHLPYSKTIPSPLDFFGTIVGAPDTLHYAEEIYSYMRALAKASPRVMVRTIGHTEEGREMIEVFIADASTIKNIQTFRGYLNDLADPRKTDSTEALHILAKAKPVYYFTAGLHSPETGSPEMVMELAYRLAVENSPMIRSIRNHVITAICPVTEPDGRDRVVDIYRWRDAHHDVTPHLTYWGHYVAHDNNRDAYGLALDLTKNILNTYLYWKPTVMHDLHESIPFLYVQTGMGPYNPYFDATTVDDWNKLAYNDVDALTRRDMPGVWTWGFFNGWAGNYLVWIANNRNSIGRFYETFGNSIPQTVKRTLGKADTTHEWYRMNPPVRKTTWSLRDNINYSETGALSALKYAALHRYELLENFYHRSSKAILEGRTKAPYAFVIPKNQRRLLATAHLINLLRENGIDVRETGSNISWSLSPNNKKDKKKHEITIEGGAFVILMDQPYRTLIGTLLDRQVFPERYKAPYDDVGWTLPYLYQVTCYKVDDPVILKTRAPVMTKNVHPEGGIINGNAPVYVVNNTTDDHIATFRLGLKDIPMQTAEHSFKKGDTSYASGSLLIDAEKLSASEKTQLADSARSLGLTVVGLNRMPDVPVHNLDVPRIALIHTWIPTPQDGGWWRVAFDKLHIPYDYLSTQDLATMNPSEYDVMILPDSYASPSQILEGESTTGPAIPWMKTKLTPNIGIIDHTTDQRKGMGYAGLEHLKQFVKRGGVLITDAGSADLPIDLGITRHIQIQNTHGLETHGSVFKADVSDTTSPITYGYPDTLAVYFNQSPVLKADTSVGGNDNYMTPDWLKREEWNRDYPRVIMRFGKNVHSLLLSGMLKHGDELAGAPAVVDVPVGKGHVVMFANHPFWRWETNASHGLVFNTILNWDDLRTGWPSKYDKKEAGIKGS